MSRAGSQWSIVFGPWLNGRETFRLGWALDSVWNELWEKSYRERRHAITAMLWPPSLCKQDVTWQAFQAVAYFFL